MDNRPIGLFDSGYGGLTVLQEVRKALPGESLVYFGDSRNAPYGRLTREECAAKALLCAEALLAKDAKALVVACNLMSGVALPLLQERFGCPVIGVIDGAVEEVDRICPEKGARVGIIGTPVLMNDGIYAAAVNARRPDIVVRGVGAVELAALVEQGKMDTPEADAAVAGYLRGFDGFAMDALVLGCTHYPLLVSSVRKVLGDGMPLVNPARNTAAAIKRVLEAEGLCCSPACRPVARYYTSGDTDTFSRFIQSVFQITGARAERMVLGE